MFSSLGSIREKKEVSVSMGNTLGWECEGAMYVFIFITFACPLCPTPADGCCHSIILDVTNVGSALQVPRWVFCSSVTGWSCGDLTASSHTLVPGPLNSLEILAARMTCRFCLSASFSKTNKQTKTHTIPLLSSQIPWKLDWLWWSFHNIYKLYTCYTRETNIKLYVNYTSK